MVLYGSQKDTSTETRRGPAGRFTPSTVYFFFLGDAFLAVFLAAGFLAAVFLGAGFLAAGFLAAVFFTAVAFFLGAVFFLGGMPPKPICS